MVESLESGGPSTLLRARAVGSLALDTVRGRAKGTTLGATSRGAFVRLGPNRVLFLTDDLGHGPLTVNLDGPVGPLAEMASGTPVQCSPAQLVFGEGEFRITLEGAGIWHVPPPKPPAEPRPAQMQRIRSLAARLVSSGRETSSIELMLALVESSTQASPFPEAQGPLRAGLALREAIATGDVEAAHRASEVLLGAGSGLTPTGDDILVGMLLMLNRWAQDALPSSERRALGIGIAAAALGRTTALSASLLSCAAEGQGPERLIRVADFVARGAGNEEACMQDVLNWGASSGIDALAGMAVAAAL